MNNEQAVSNRKTSKAKQLKKRTLMTQSYSKNRTKTGISCQTYISYISKNNKINT
jgi:hypothetical protein